MKKFQKVYLEISNICNMNCAFCPGTSRTKHSLTEDEFNTLAHKLRPHTDYLYFHLMGEPFRHLLLLRFLEIADSLGFRVILTTNGTLLGKMHSVLSSPALHKVNISLHSFEANVCSFSMEQYLHDCFAFGQAASDSGVIVNFRLWNQGGMEQYNRQIFDTLALYFPQPWVPARTGMKLGSGVYLEHGVKFDWPDLSAPRNDGPVFCYGLRDQLGVLCDGTVVPCCLDHNGDIALGNLFLEDLPQILSSQRAKSLYDGFSCRRPSEELCRHCGYALRFQ